MKSTTKFQKWLIKFRNLTHCRSCRKVITPRWKKDHVLFEDEPPLFYHYECPHCGYHLTNMIPTAITENAVKKLGYRDFKDYVGKAFSR